MQRTALFVDGSYLQASLNGLELRVDDYARFFSHLYRRALDEWAIASLFDVSGSAMLSRIYLYVVSSMDEWDLSNERAQGVLREAFEKDRDLRAKYLGEAGDVLSALDSQKRPHEHLLGLAWDRCFSDLRTWYLRQQTTLETLRRFHYAVQTANDFVDVVEAGHWRVDMLSRRIDERGIDAAMSLDLGTRAGEFDLAVVLAEDRAVARALSHLKQAGRHVSLVELVPGEAPDDHGRSGPSHLRTKVDFVTRVFADELIEDGLARRAAHHLSVEHAGVPSADTPRAVQGRSVPRAASGSMRTE